MQRKSKRSSILKPPKPTVRAPLQDLDSLQVEEDDGNSTQQSNRRVSFSRTSQVKEFDPTIGYMTQWNQKYEETLNIMENDENRPTSSNDEDDLMQPHPLKLINKKRRSTRFQLSINSAGIEAVGNVCFDSKQNTQENIDEKMLSKQPRTSISYPNANDHVKGDMSLFCKDLDVSFSRGDKSICSNRTDNFYDSSIYNDHSILENSEGQSLRMKKDWSTSEPIVKSSSNHVRITSGDSNPPKIDLSQDNSYRRRSRSFHNQMEKENMTLAVGGIQDSDGFSFETSNLNMEMTVPLGKIILDKPTLEQNKSVDNEINEDHSCTEYDPFINEKILVSQGQNLEQLTVQTSEKIMKSPKSLLLCKTLNSDADMDMTWVGGTIEINRGRSEGLDDCHEDLSTEVGSKSLDFTVPLGNLKLQNVKSFNPDDSISLKLNALKFNDSSLSNKSSKEKRASSPVIETDQCDVGKASDNISGKNVANSELHSNERGDETLNAVEMDLTETLGMLNVPEVDISGNNITLESIDTTAALRMLNVSEVDISGNNIQLESIDTIATLKGNILAAQAESKENIAPISDTHGKLLTGKGTKRFADDEVGYSGTGGIASHSAYERSECYNQIFTQENESVQCMEFTVPLGRLKIQKLENPTQTAFSEPIDTMKQKDRSITIGADTMGNLPTFREYGEKHQMCDIDEILGDSDMECTLAGGAFPVDPSNFNDSQAQKSQEEDEICPGPEGMDFTVPLGKILQQKLEKTNQERISSIRGESCSIIKCTELKENETSFLLDDNEQDLTCKNNWSSTKPEGMEFTVPLGKLIHKESENVVSNTAIVRPIPDDICCDSNEIININNQNLQQEDETLGMEFTVPHEKLIHKESENVVSNTAIVRPIPDDICCDSNEIIDKTKKNLQQEDETLGMEFTVPHGKLIHKESENVVSNTAIVRPIPDDICCDSNEIIDKTKKNLQQEDETLGMEFTVPLGKLINKESENVVSNTAIVRPIPDDICCDSNEIIYKTNQNLQQEDETLGMEFTVPLGKLMQQANKKDDSVGNVFHPVLEHYEQINQISHPNRDEKYGKEIEESMVYVEVDDSISDSTTESPAIAVASKGILKRLDSSTDGNDSFTSINKTLSEQCSVVLSPEVVTKHFDAEEWIKEESEKRTCPWQVFKLTENEWSFVVFHKSVKLTLQLEGLSENKTRFVKHVELKSCLIEGNRDSDYVVHKVFLERCPPTRLIDLCPNTAQIPELFQFLNLEVQNMTALLRQATWLDKRYAVIFQDDGFIYSVASMKLMKLFYVRVKLVNWQSESIQPEDVTITNYVGKTRESDIQGVVALVKKDKNFLANLYDTMLEYMEQLEELLG